MSMFDNIKAKAEEILGQNQDKVEEISDQGITKAGDAVDNATGGKFQEQVDQGQQMADDYVGEGSVQNLEADSAQGAEDLKAGAQDALGQAKDAVDGK
ncbi:MAG: antitoxin [Micrococcales bacterium]|nr:antitoxin [Micrococcales bacterium]